MRNGNEKDWMGNDDKAGGKTCNGKNEEDGNGKEKGEGLSGRKNVEEVLRESQRKLYHSGGCWGVIMVVGGG